MKKGDILYCINYNCYFDKNLVKINVGDKWIVEKVVDRMVYIKDNGNVLALHILTLCDLFETVTEHRKRLTEELIK